MKTRLAPQQRGEGILDVLAIIAAVAVVALFVLLPMHAKSRARPRTINCVNNLKQIGLSFKLWAGDNNDKYPMQVSTNQGGTMELVGSGAAYPHFNVMSNELSTPKILHCPKDPKKEWPTNFVGLSDSYVSYFVVPEADGTLPLMWLAGDRNLTVNAADVKSGSFTFKANKILGWSAQLHKFQGNLGFADGSAQQITNARLQPSASKALHSYFTATSNTSFRIAVP
jgi:hypothetical protein